MQVLYLASFILANLGSFMKMRNKTLAKIKHSTVLHFMAILTFNGSFTQNLQLVSLNQELISIRPFNYLKHHSSLLFVAYHQVR